MPEPAAQPQHPGPPAPASPGPPALPGWLRAPWPVVVVIATGWALAFAAAFLIADLAPWRPTCVAGLGVGVVGTAIFLWQRSAARRGSRGAQLGFD